jgi:hypothetical protein
MAALFESLFESLFDELKEIKKAPTQWALRVVLDHGAWYLGVFIVWAFPTWIFKYFQSSSLTNYEKVIIGIICVISVFFAMVALVVIRKIVDIYKKNQHLTQLIEAFGIKGFYPYISQDQRKKEWDILIDEFHKARPQNLKILALNGWGTFTSEQSPLHDYLKKFDGELTVLLIDPNCKACSIRRTTLGVDEQQFILDHKKSVEFCKELKQKNIKIRLFFYSQTPIWKMIGTESYIWLQHYDKRSHVEENPVYEFYKDTEKTSMYFPLMAVMDKKLLYDEENKEIPL